MVVDTRVHRLALCRGSRAVRTFPVAIGYAGAGKRRQGDGKTPLGTYPLGPGRASASGFHRFIPVGYPTASQRAAGYTGSAVGVHGPARSSAALGERANTDTDWTLGCIALGSDAAIDALEAWMRRHSAGTVHIE